MSLITKLLSISVLPLFLSFIPLLQIKALALDPTTSLSLINPINVAGNETDFHALLAFKSNIFPEYQQALSSWNESLHFCHWEGVKCGHRHERVIIIDLTSIGLMGSLSPYIGNLSFLHELSLKNNTFIGEIPTELGNLFRLQKLNLEQNGFKGGHGIPPSIGNLTSLEHFDASNDPFGGSIPNALGQLKILRELWLGNTTISEYGLGSEMSTSGDFYSYGILLLEMITRKRPTDKMFEANLNLHNFARIALPQRAMEIVDPMLLTEETYGSKIIENMISLIKIGLACSTESPKNRMNINTALLHLVKNNILKVQTLGTHSSHV